MAKILEEIQTRLGEAQKQLADTTQALTIAQQKQQTAQHSFNVWVAAAQLEQRDEQLRQAAATEKQSVLPLPATRPEPSASIPPIPIEQPVDASEGPNKTDVVRNLLKQHPTGMSAVDIWKEVGAQFKHRPYLYSVLKRLRDREEVIKRRSKYCLTAISKVEGVKEQSLVH